MLLYNNACADLFCWCSTEVVQLIRNQQVVGSIPTTSSIKKHRLGSVLFLFFFEMRRYSDAALPRAALPHLDFRSAFFPTRRRIAVSHCSRVDIPPFSAAAMPTFSTADVLRKISSSSPRGAFPYGGAVAQRAAQADTAAQRLSRIPRL